MRVLMLGWEFPPFISGGLGTACYGLTKALSQQQVQILFVLPRPVPTDYSAHVSLLSPQSHDTAASQTLANSLGSDVSPDVLSALADGTAPSLTAGQTDFPFDNVTFRTIRSGLISPYQSAGGRFHAGAVGQIGTEAGESNGVEGKAGAGKSLQWGEGPMAMADWPRADYQGDMIDESRRYAALALILAQGEQFDVIHAHDWLTFPAGLAIAAVKGKPLVVQVHSTEFDRAGANIQQQVYDIERRGMLGSCRVICVSYLTKSIVQHRYGVDPDKIDVVYNGIDDGMPTGGNGPRAGRAADRPRADIKRGDKIVLFLGRITMQKGPEYFVGAAKLVLEKYDRVKFVMAGSGDKIRDTIELAAEQGIGHKVLFTGFLRGPDVQRIFNMADVYVMPSVSEPFGIAPLEAIRHDVPVIVSKTSGVAEVLTHVLKVDFWDTREIANKIIAVLRHPPLSSTLREHADIEVRRLTWADAATKCLHTYHRAIKMMPA